MISLRCSGQTQYIVTYSSVEVLLKVLFLRTLRSESSSPIKSLYFLVVVSYFSKSIICELKDFTKELLEDISCNSCLCVELFSTYAKALISNMQSRVIESSSLGFMQNSRLPKSPGSSPGSDSSSSNAAGTLLKL